MRRRPGRPSDLRPGAEKENKVFSILTEKFPKQSISWFEEGSSALGVSLDNNLLILYISY